MRLLLLALVGALPAAADEGEFQLGVGLTVDAAVARHPAAKSEALAAIDGDRTVALTSGLILRGTHGISNELGLTIGIAAGAASNVVTPTVISTGEAVQIRTGGYFDLAVPMGMQWRFDTGDYAAAAAIDIGPSTALWTASALVDPQRLDSEGRPVRLPLAQPDLVVLRGFAGMRMSADLRVCDSLSIAIGIQARVATDLSAQIGVSAEPAWITAPGFQ